MKKAEFDTASMWLQTDFEAHLLGLLGLIGSKVGTEFSRGLGIGKTSSNKHIFWIYYT